MTAAHTLGPVAAKTVEIIGQYRHIDRKHYHAVFAVEGETRAALAAYTDGNADVGDLADRLRDILAICEAAGGGS